MTDKVDFELKKIEKDVDDIIRTIDKAIKKLEMVAA
jgi:hypothetical protein